MTERTTKSRLTDVQARRVAESRLAQSLRRVQYLLERSMQLLQIQRRITGRLSLEEVLDSVIRSAAELLQIDAAETLLLNPDGKTFDIRASESVQPSPVGTKTLISERPIAERVIREGELIVVEDVEKEPSLQIPILVGGKMVRALASVPLRLEDKIIGALNVYSSKPKRFSEEDIRTLTMFAEGAAVAVSNARLYADVIRERKRLQTVLDTIPSGIIITEGPEARIAFMNSRCQEFFGTPPEIGKPLPAYLASSKLLHPDGTPFSLNDLPINRSMRNGEVVHSEELVIEMETGQRSYLLLGSAPLYDELGNIYGAVASTEDITPLRKAQEALSEAYARERRVFEELQQALLPRVPDRIDGLYLASAYRAAKEEARIGGDFFDVFHPGPDLVGIVIGDVAGKGAEAASHTALTRHSLKAYAYIDPSPAYVMEALANAIARETPPEFFVTVFYGLLNLREKTLCYASAGHEPSLCLIPDNPEIVLLTSTGIPLGIRAGSTYEQQCIRFPNGSRVMLYTDGVTEVRAGTEFFGLERLKEFFVRYRQDPPADFINRLLEYVQSFAHPHLRDDIALLLVEMGLN